MADRLDAEGDTPENNFAARFGAQIKELVEGGIKQSGKTGDVSSLTLEQQDALKEFDRLTAGARRSAKLAFPGEAARLRSEFQVGVNEPDTLAAQLERGEKIHAACGKYDAELKKSGWIKADTEALAATIALLSGKSLDQAEALDERIGLTDARIEAANAVYSLCLKVQNAARLQHPAGKSGTATARARFLLDEFPPRDRSDPGASTEPPPQPPPTPPAPKP